MFGRGTCLASDDSGLGTSTLSWPLYCKYIAPTIDHSKRMDCHGDKISNYDTNARKYNGNVVSK